MRHRNGKRISVWLINCKRGIIIVITLLKVRKSDFEYDFEGEPHQMRPNLKILRLSKMIMSQRKHIGREDGRLNSEKVQVH